MVPTKQMVAKAKYVPDKLIKSSILGSNLVTKNAKVQLVEKAIEAQSLLASGEWISAFSVHAKGPKPMEKAMTKTIKLTTGNQPRLVTKSGSKFPSLQFSWTSFKNMWRRSRQWYPPGSGPPCKFSQCYKSYQKFHFYVSNLLWHSDRVLYCFHNWICFHQCKNKIPKQIKVMPWTD